MSEAFNSIRALLREFRSTPWSELHVSGKDFEYFLTRRSGSQSPLRPIAQEPTEIDDAIEQGEQISVTCAPHLGIFRPVKPNGLAVREGEVLAEIDVLDRVTSIVALSDGVVTNLAKDGDLVQYGAEIVSLSTFG